MTTPAPRVLVTRAQADAAALVHALQAMGAQVHCQPAVQMVPIAAGVAGAAAMAAWDSLCAVACASRYGVRYLADWLHAHTLSLPAAWTLFAVGPATADACRVHLSRDAVTASPHTAVGLAAGILAQVRPPAGVLVPTARGAGGLLARALCQGGLTPWLLPLYATELVVPSEPMTGGPAVDYIVFTSPSCVRGYMASGHVWGAARIITLGPTTTAAVQAAGLTPFAQAAPASLAGLIDVLKAILCPR